jgi:hypothetical protein
VTFDELLAQVFELLQREKRLSYRALKVRFGLDDEHLEALKDEIIEVKQLAVDDKGRVLVWTGESAVPAPPAAGPAPVPLAAIPAYLAEKIRTARGALEGERKQVTVLFAAARIDRLPPEPKHLLQTAAVIGHDVPLALLRALIELPEEALHRSLAQLQGEVTAHREPPEAEQAETHYRQALALTDELGMRPL